ncbi:MAG: hypothetical protein RL735_167 [Pseudomonadota bacterium]|jgi:hypothetical protein
MAQNEEFLIQKALEAFGLKLEELDQSELSVMRKRVSLIAAANAEGMDGSDESDLPEIPISLLEKIRQRYADRIAAKLAGKKENEIKLLLADPSGRLN